MKTPEEFINQKTGLSINDNGSRMILSLNEVAEMLEEYATLTRPVLPSDTLEKIHDMMIRKQYRNARMALGSLIYSIKADICTISALPASPEKGGQQ